MENNYIDVERRRDLEHCPLCHRNCALSDPQCPRGQAYRERLTADQIETGAEAVDPRYASPQAADGDDALADQFRILGRYLSHQGGGRGGQRRVLSILANRGSIAQRELMEMLQVQPGSLSELLSKLEDRGLVDRAKGDGDRRSLQITITAAGHRMQESMKDEEHGLGADLFSCLSSDEKEQLKTIFSKLQSHWEGRFGSHHRGRAPFGRRSGAMDWEKGRCEGHHGEGRGRGHRHPRGGGPGPWGDL